jgi:hypothetical protein
MSSHEDDDRGEDVGKLKRSALEQLVMKYRAKRLKDRDPDEQKKADDEAEEERNKLSDLHEEQHGSAPKLAVEKDDLPEGLEDALEEDDEDEKKPAKKQKA